MSSKLTTEIFINKAKEIHGDKYDYSKVIYIKSKEKVKIICPLHGIFEQIPNSHLTKQGCATCAGNVKLTIDTFINRSNIVHNNYYIYDKVMYISLFKKIEILCPKHGLFNQRPADHLAGKGCVSCGYEKLKIKDFASRARLVHSDKYNYQFVIYKNKTTEVKIICQIHGEFFQTPHNHLHGQGCQKCSENLYLTRRQIEFFKQANQIHDNKYNYDKSIYINNNIKIIINCPIHGIFKQQPNNHLMGRGCPDCHINSTKSTLEDFIKKANVVHNKKYDYSKSFYTGSANKININCPVHGNFSQKVNSHLNGQGCSKCAHTYSKIENKWLDILLIKNEYRQKIIKINNKKYKVDAYVPETNTVYEFYGDYWHGNPNSKKYLPEAINHANKKSFGELYNKTMQREQELKDAGFNIISIWESDFKKIIK